MYNDMAQIGADDRMFIPGNPCHMRPWLWSIIFVFPLPIKRGQHFDSSAPRGVECRIYSVGIIE